MRLLSAGTISPLGSTLEEHSINISLPLEPTFQEYKIKNEIKKIAVYRAKPVTYKLPVPDAVMRRMGLSTQLVLSAIEDAKARNPIDLDHKKVGLIVGTTQGPSSTNIDYFRRLVSFQYKGASPNLFAQSVHNNIAASVAITYQWKGPSLTLVQEDNLLESMFDVAELWFAQGRVDYLWMIMGNEMSLHVPYIQLYEHLEKNPLCESYLPPEPQISYEAFSSFLFAADSESGGVPLNISLAKQAIQEDSQKKAVSIVKPEHLGVLVCEKFCL